MDLGSLRKIKKEAQKTLVLDSKYRPYIFLIVLFILFLIPISTLESSPQLSICTKALGKYCYSTGIIRGVSSLLKLDLQTALNYNWLSIPTLITMLAITIIDLFKKFKAQQNSK